MQVNVTLEEIQHAILILDKCHILIQRVAIEQDDIAMLVALLTNNAELYQASRDYLQSVYKWLRDSKLEDL